MKIVGNWAYTYDADGNLVEKGSAYTVNADGTISYLATEGEYWSYGYDLWNRMTAVSKSTSGTAKLQLLASYQYDPESLRIGKTTPTASYRYWYGIDGKVLAEERTSGGDTRLRTYVYAAGKLLGYDETIGGTKKRYWTCTDQLDSVTAETDSTGAIVAKKEYANFGAAGLSETQSGTHESLSWYAGHECDPDAELVYSNYRWYDPQTGTFTTEDPIGAGENWYQYCGANPMTHIDFCGLLWDAALAHEENREYEYGHITSQAEKENLHSEYEQDRREHPHERILPSGGGYENTPVIEYKNGNIARWGYTSTWRDDVTDPRDVGEYLAANSGNASDAGTRQVLSQKAQDRERNREVRVMSEFRSSTFQAGVVWRGVDPGPTIETSGPRQYELRIPVPIGEIPGRLLPVGFDLPSSLEPNVKEGGSWHPKKTGYELVGAAASPDPESQKIQNIFTALLLEFTTDAENTTILTWNVQVIGCKQVTTDISWGLGWIPGTPPNGAEAVRLIAKNKKIITDTILAAGALK